MMVVGQGKNKFLSLSRNPTGSFSERLSTIWSSVEAGWCSRTMTLNIKVNLLQNGLKNKICPLEWPSESPELYPAKMLWNDLKRAVHTTHLKNMAEPKQFCKEEWSNIVQVWSLATEGACLRLLLPKEVRPESSLTFSTSTVDVQLVCIIKTWKIIILFVLLA